MHKVEVKNRSQRGWRIRRLAQGLLPLALCLLGVSAVAQSSSRVLSEPPSLPPLPPQVGERVGREIRYQLELTNVKGTIYNPSTGTEDIVSLRSYVAVDKNQTPIPAPKFIAPIIYMKPGETVRITLHNNLEPEEDESKCTNHNNDPNCFNSTNLHAHGLWVSPSGNSDNVLLEIKPKTSFQYEYNVPEDHPAGTYWYHPHVHGSTAVQVASGMAGALIIRGDRVPTFTQDGQVQTPGDIDALLKPFEPKVVPTSKVAGEMQKQEYEEPHHDYAEVLLFQQIPYACFDEKNQIKIESKDKNNAGRWACGEKDVGEVKVFKSQIGAGTWSASGRYTSINGFVQPEIPMQAGRVYRWRLIDAGIHESIGLRITKVDPSKWPKKPTPDEEKKFIESDCGRGEVVNQFEIATDGLTREQIVKRDTNTLQPGYRSDVLFAFPSEGTYCLYDAATRTGIAANNKEAIEGPRLLGRVTVQGGKAFPSEEQEKFIKSKLKDAAEKQFTDLAVRAKVSDDLDHGLKTTAFAPHKSFSKEEREELDRKTPEHVTFNITADKAVPNKASFQINDKSFKADNEPDHTLLLNTAQEWILMSEVGNHPFHIHVNPFQIIQILKKDEKDSKYKEITYAEDPDYAGMKDAWKDTILVKKDYKLIIATRYERYIGDFVLHCHILDHEDQGMMQSVRIELTDSKGQPVPPGHQHH